MGFINVLEILTEGFYSLTSGIYYFLGNLYTFIVDLATTNFINSSVIEDFVRTIYVLAGVFMLFRVAVSFLNSLIDPDKFTDKNEGASKILTRLVIVVVLMIGLAPGSFVYRFLDRLQNAVVGEDGLIVNIVGKAELNVSSAINKYISDINPFGDMSVDAEDWDKLPLNSIVKTKSGVCYKLTAYGNSGSNPTFTKVASCGKDYWTLKGGYCNQTYTTSNAKADLTRYPATLLRGSSTLKNVLVTNAICEGKQVDDGFKNSGLVTDIDDGSNKGSKKVTLDSGGLFAQSVLNTMTSCPNVDDQASKECTKDIKGNVLVDNDKAISDIDDKKLSVSWLIAIIVGIVVIIYLAVLCIEVVVRSLKLMLLQMISPIAIISYVSPKDKILGQWAKMYASTYLDLFIKLFAIKLGAELIGAIKFSGSVIKDLILILGCLVFMKVIPTVISKIFGIDIASGTLKDSMGMLKAGIGASAGAAVGSIVGASTGKGIGRLTGALRGFGAGAQSGYKGDIASGAKNVSNKNQRINTAKEQGLNFFDRTSAVMAAKMGMPTKGAVAKDKLSKINDVASANKDLKDWVEGEAVKKNAIATDFSYKDADGNSLNFRQELNDYNNLEQKSRTSTLTTQEQNRLNQLRRQGFANFTNGVGVGELQSKLDALESRDTSRMTDQELATHARTLTETKSMLAAAKTSAAANYIKDNRDDAEIIARVNKVNDAIAEARLSGADNVVDDKGNRFVFEDISLDSINEKTIKNIKESAYGMQNAIGKDAEKELAKERYGNTNS